MNYCPECGTPVEGQPKFCPECGGSLQPQSAEATQGDSASVQDAGDTAIPVPPKRKTTPLIIGVAVVAVLLVVAGVVVFGGGGRTEDVEASDEAQQEYIDENSLALADALKGMNTYGAPYYWQKVRDSQDAYVSVGWAADYPDSVLVTIVIPAQSATQLVFKPGDTDESVYVVGQSVNESSLDASVKNWNARIDENGYFLLNGYEEECLPDDFSQAPAPSSASAPQAETDSSSGDEVATDAQASGFVGSSRKGETLYLVIFASETERDAAEGKYEEIVGMLGDPLLEQTVQIVDSSGFDGLTPGYQVVIMPCEEEAVAQGEADYFSGFGMDAYVKQVVVNTDTPLTVNSAMGD